MLHQGLLMPSLVILKSSYLYRYSKNLYGAMTMGTSNEDPKNRAFEAIARREAHDLHLQQQKINNNNKRYEGSSGLKRTNQDVASSSNAVNTPSKKGKYSFSGQTFTRDPEADHPIYLPLSHLVHEKLAMQDHEVNVVDKILHELLQSGDSAQNYGQGSRRMKIDNRIHLDYKVQERKVSLAKTFQSHSKRSKKHMSMKQHKKCGSLDLPREFHRKSQIAQCLLGADLHGSHILVAECKMAAFKGVNGIMIRETAETFGIITKENKFKVVLKKISIFMLQIDCWKITLHGDKLTSRKIGQ